jgi:hypothetical protein
MRTKFLNRYRQLPALVMRVVDAAATFLLSGWFGRCGATRP